MWSAGRQPQTYYGEQVRKERRVCVRKERFSWGKLVQEAFRRRASDAELVSVGAARGHLGESF